MSAVLLTAKTEIDADVGFRYRMVYAASEGSLLHHHDYYEIFLTLADNVYHEINGVIQYLPRGTLVFIRKDDVHYYSGKERRELSFVNLAFTEELLCELFHFLSEGFCSQALLSAEMPPSVQLYDTNIDWILRQMEKLNSNLLNDVAKLKFLSRTLLFQIFTRFFSDFENNMVYESMYIPPWLLDLEKKMKEPKNFSQHSDHMVELSGKSRAYIGRMLKKYYNKTISEYINDLRLNYWANSLITSDAPILDICYECGFENASWAYTLFKEKYNTSPMKFRKDAHLG